MDAEAQSHRPSRYGMVTTGVLLCLHGHGPLDGWRKRGRRKRGRYCRVCNVDANRRFRERQRAAR